jgi:hypothetical protein
LQAKRKCDVAKKLWCGIIGGSRHRKEAHKNERKETTSEEREK